MLTNIFLEPVFHSEHIHLSATHLSLFQLFNPLIKSQKSCKFVNPRCIDVGSHVDSIYPCV